MAELRGSILALVFWALSSSGSTAQDDPYANIHTIGIVSLIGNTAKFQYKAFAFYTSHGMLELDWDTGTELQQLEHRWGQLTQILQNLRQEDFLKVYWTSRHGLIQLDDIFDAVIEEHERSAKFGAAGKGLGPQSDLTLEHILPENPGAEWAAAIAKNPKLADFSDRTGNLCLLPAGSNKDLGNAGFKAKKPVYAASDLLTTQQVALANSDWDDKTIEARQVWLSSRAVAIWRIA